MCRRGGEGLKRRPGRFRARFIGNLQIAGTRVTSSSHVAPVLSATLTGPAVYRGCPRRHSAIERPAAPRCLRSARSCAIVGTVRRFPIPCPIGSIRSPCFCLSMAVLLVRSSCRVWPWLSSWFYEQPCAVRLHDRSKATRFHANPKTVRFD